MILQMMYCIFVQLYFLYRNNTILTFILNNLERLLKGLGSFDIFSSIIQVSKISKHYTFKPLYSVK